jgi:hypothetical protein
LAPDSLGSSLLKLELGLDSPSKLELSSNLDRASSISLTSLDILFTLRS